ncbi:hypothetical protein B296_00002765 [Ensete ventricosum]|uniref:Chromosome transmission fidelity protein 8 n=1 Tax=Ensete ventricosum TaxID=4639 RepID=A0A427B7Q6_ENSVE|nr:hypothetical protein B296_00002765 [Ensete ventricosum]
MQIRVKCNCGEKCPEWAIVELQGVVESQLATSDQINGLEIGHLCCPSLSSSSSQPSYTFTVGYHELSGTKVQLKKPLLVLKKKAAVDAAGTEFSSSSAVELEVIGIIRQKILFKTRPKALISRKNISSIKILRFLEV